MTTASTPSGVSSTGATLSGSYTGATGSVTETGFYYGINSGSLGTKVNTWSTSTPFSTTLTNLSANTTYYYKAYIVEGGEEVLGSVESFTTKAVATATVTTKAVSGIGATAVTLNGRFEGATGTIYNRGFSYWKKNDQANSQLVELGSTTGTSGDFTSNVSGLSELTTYQVQAFVTEWDENANQYVDIWGSIVEFTTLGASLVNSNYLQDYGMPNVTSLSTGLGTSGTNSDRDDHWYRYNTTNNNRQIAVHTYTHPDTNEETLNYVVLYDGTKYAPVWTYHVMNDLYWEDKDVGRNESWTKDPAISLTQQSGLKNAGTVGYSRGHLVASDYRQTTVKQNQQTFYYSNQAPQYQNGFNSGVWSTLEQRVKTMRPTVNNIMLYVVTGVLYEGNVTSLDGTSATNSTTLSVPIPSHFYKCIMRCTFSGTTISQAQGIAFVYTNKSHSSATSYYGTDFNGSESFVTSIDAIETRAGFDFFSGVPTGVQNTAEANTDPSWFTKGSSQSNVMGITDLNWGAF